MIEYRPGLDRTYGALAHPVRRGLLELLRAGQVRVTDLAEPFDISLAAASKHLQVLEIAGLVSRTVVGRDHLMALESQPLIQARDWIDSYRSFWESRIDALEAQLRRNAQL
ncbi:MAG TPA: metalloregulator ArsR/SmtB family transcription factor [Candidatus Dormibacteraeota bacterium]